MFLIELYTIVDDSCGHAALDGTSLLEFLILSTKINLSLTHIHSSVDLVHSLPPLWFTILVIFAIVLHDKSKFLPIYIIIENTTIHEYNNTVYLYDIIHFVVLDATL